MSRSIPEFGVYNEIDPSVLHNAHDLVGPEQLVVFDVNGGAVDLKHATPEVSEQRLVLFDLLQPLMEFSPRPLNISKLTLTVDTHSAEPGQAQRNDFARFHTDPYPTVAVSSALPTELLQNGVSRHRSIFGMGKQINKAIIANQDWDVKPEILKNHSDRILERLGFSIESPEPFTIYGFNNHNPHRSAVNRTTEAIPKIYADMQVQHL